MTILKKTWFCASAFLACGSDVLAAHELVSKYALRRSLSTNLQQVICQTQISFSAPRYYSNTYSKNAQFDINNLGDSRERQALSLSLPEIKELRDNLEKCESLLILNHRIFKEIQPLISALRRTNNIQGGGSSFLPVMNGQSFDVHSAKSATKRQRDPERTPALIVPINSDGNFDREISYSNKKSLSFSEPENIVSPIVLSHSKETSLYQATEEDEIQSQDLSKIPFKIRSDFVNRLMQSAKNPYKTTQQDLIAILDLYTDLIIWKKERITNVLNGRTNGHQSNVHSAVVKHLTSRQSTLSLYRDMYERLCEGFGEDGIQVIYKVMDNMLFEKKDMRYHFKKKSNGGIGRQDYISMAVLGANPLYPVHPNEIELILDLFSALKSWKKEMVTNVLNGRTNSHQSNVYSAVVKHALSKQTTLYDYRNIYSRLSKSLNGVVLNFLHNVDTSIDVNTNRSTPNMLENNQTDSEVEEDSLTSESSYVSALSDQKSLSSDSNSDEIQIRSENFNLSSSKELLERISALLPKLSVKRIIKALYETPKNDKDSVDREALLRAIDQINREKKRNGDSTPINLKYFQKLSIAKPQEASHKNSIVKKKTSTFVLKKKKTKNVKK